MKTESASGTHIADFDIALGAFLQAVTRDSRQLSHFPTAAAQLVLRVLLSIKSGHRIILYELEQEMRLHLRSLALRPVFSVNYLRSEHTSYV